MFSITQLCLTLSMRAKINTNGQKGKFGFIPSFTQSTEVWAKIKPSLPIDKIVTIKQY